MPGELIPCDLFSCATAKNQNIVFFTTAKRFIVTWKSRKSMHKLCFTYMLHGCNPCFQVSSEYAKDVRQASSIQRFSSDLWTDGERGGRGR